MAIRMQARSLLKSSAPIQRCDDASDLVFSGLALNFKRPCDRISGMIETVPSQATDSRMLTNNHLTRRRFLQLGTMLAAGLILPPSLMAVPRPDDPGERYLKFFNTHTQERLEVCYHCNGRYRRDAIAAVNNILRDHRTDEVHPIDLRLLDLLHTIPHHGRPGQLPAHHFGLSVSRHECKTAA